MAVALMAQSGAALGTSAARAGVPLVPTMSRAAADNAPARFFNCMIDLLAPSGAHKYSDPAPGVSRLMKPCGGGEYSRFRGTVSSLPGWSCGEHMICPLPRASDLSAFTRRGRGPTVGLLGGANGALGSRLGAGDDDSAGDPAGVVGRDSLVSGGRDPGREHANDASLPLGTGQVGLRGPV